MRWLALIPAALFVRLLLMAVFPDAADQTGLRRVALASQPQRPASKFAHPKSSLYDSYFSEAAGRFGLPVSYLKAVTHVESRFNHRARSPDGALGLMQLMPFTAREMGVRDRLDPRENIFGGARYLRRLANRWHGNLVFTTASYNAGPGAVARYHGIPPFRETQRYVRRVLAYYRVYRGERAP